MPLSLGRQSIGSTREYQLTLESPDGSSLAGKFTGAETFRARLWLGDDLAPAWDSNSAVAWIAYNIAKPTLKLTVPRSAIAGLKPALWYLSILINPGTDDIEVCEPGTTLELVPAADGAGASLPAYTERDELLQYAPWLGEVVARDTRLRGDLSEQRNLARQWIDRTAIARARRILEAQADAHEPVLAVDPIEPADGVDAGPAYGPSVYPDTTVRDQLRAIQGHLDADRLILDTGVREAAARYAVSLTCEALLGRGPDESGYQQTAARNRTLAMHRLAGTPLRIDTNGDGVAEMELI